MKLATAAGFPLATATALTPEDVKAADSDQVTIAFDTQGNYKKQVPADWYDHFIRARDVRDKVEDAHLNKEGVHRVGLNPGSDGDNPHVEVGLDADSNKKDERRGEIPESRNDVKIKISEENGAISLDACNDETADVTSLPGSVASAVGALSVDVTNPCSNGPRFINGSEQDFAFGWSTASHCMHFDFIANSCQSQWGVEHKGTKYGDVVFWDHTLDIAYIEQNSDGEPVSKVVYPADHSTSHHINGTVSESGMGTVTKNNLDGKVWGVESCEVTGKYDSINNSFDADHPCHSGDQTDQVLMNVGSELTQGGDSGATHLVKEPNTTDWFVASSHSGSIEQNNADNFIFGPQGFSIRNQHNIWWDDLQ